MRYPTTVEPGLFVEGGNVEEQLGNVDELAFAKPRGKVRVGVQLWGGFGR